MIPYSHQCIYDDDIESVIAVLRSEYLTQGPKVEEFEQALADYCGAKYCVAFSNATAALYAAFFALDIKRKFITTPISFVATSNAGVFNGARPVFVDIDLETGNLDVGQIEDGLSEDVEAIVGVDYAGQPLNWKKLRQLAEKHGLKVIDDASHALGAECYGKKIGNCEFADITIFSFHPVKPITTGEGGAALTCDREIYEKLKQFRNHGITKDRLLGKPDGEWYYEMQFLSFNGRMSDIQAALGISQLKKLDEFIEERRRVAELYKEYFADKGYFKFLEEKPFAKGGYHLLAVLLEDRFKNKKREIFSVLRQNGIGVQVHYMPIYKHPFYRQAGYHNLCLPNAEEFYKRELSLPVYPCLYDDRDKLLKVFDVIDEIFKG